MPENYCLRATTETENIKDVPYKTNEEDQLNENEPKSGEETKSDGGETVTDGGTTPEGTEPAAEGEETKPEGTEPVTEGEETKPEETKPEETKPQQEKAAEPKSQAPAPQRKVTIFTSARLVMSPGEVITLTSVLEGFEDCQEIRYQWECDQGQGFAPVPGATADSWSFESSPESLSWNWRLIVYCR